MNSSEGAAANCAWDACQWIPQPGHAPTNGSCIGSVASTTIQNVATDPLVWTMIDQYSRDPSTPMTTTNIDSAGATYDQDTVQGGPAFCNSRQSRVTQENDGIPFCAALT